MAEVFILWDNASQGVRRPLPTFELCDIDRGMRLNGTITFGEYCPQLTVADRHVDAR